MTLRDKFLLPTILMIILGLGSSILASRHVSKTAIEKLINNELILMAESTQQQLQSWVVICKQTIVSLGVEKYSKIALRDTFMGNAAKKAAHKLLLKKKSECDYFGDFCIIAPDGIIVASSDPDKNFQKVIFLEPYFENILKGEIVITDIFEDRETGNPVFIIAAPIYERDEIVGVIAGHVNFGYFCDIFFAKVTVGTTGYVIICNKEGSVVCHPDHGMFFKIKLEDMSLAPDIGELKADFIEYSFNGVNKYGAAKKFRDAGWTVLMVVDVSDIMKPLSKVNCINMCIFGLCLLVALVVILAFTRFVIKPLNLAINFTRGIKSGNFFQTINIKTNDEIGQLSIALKDMAEQLHQNIKCLAKANQELLKEREIAESANQAKSEFLANMSHEIRTPLNAVAGFSDILSSMITDPKQKIYLKGIDIAGKSLLTLINDILDLSKIEAGKLEIMIKEVNLTKLIKEIDLIFRESTVKKGLNLIIDVDEEVPDIVLLDEARVRQVLLNLVGNSLKFTDKGDITVIARSKNLRQELEICDLFLGVKDTGCGIGEQNINRIFEPFEQVCKPGEKLHAGTGLGLAICKSLVDAMNGKITFTSEIGTGTMFSIILKDVKIVCNKNGNYPHEMLQAHENIDFQDSVSEHMENSSYICEAFDEILKTKKEEKSGKGLDSVKSEAENLDISQELKEVLINELGSAYESIRSFMLMSNARGFALKLKELGSEYNNSLLIDRSSQLIEYVDVFDIQNINKLLDDIGDIFEVKIQ